MVPVGAFVAMGTAPQELEFHMGAALNAGVTPRELLEVIIQMAVYAGIPACLEGITVFRKTLEERGIDFAELKK